MKIPGYMNEIFKIVPVVLYFFVGIVSFVMAYKTLAAKKFLTFHEKAAGKSWDELDKSLKIVYSTILKISGLGFFVNALLLTVFPIMNYFKDETFVKFAIPIISLIFCFGLFLFNYSLYKQTNADTPWKKSLMVIFIIFAGIIISCL